MMETSTQLMEFQENGTFSNSVNLNIRIIQSTTASLGIITNLTVIVAFLNHKILRKKIPNIFIVNQVRETKLLSFIYLKRMPMGYVY